MKSSLGFMSHIHKQTYDTMPTRSRASWLTTTRRTTDQVGVGQDENVQQSDDEIVSAVLGRCARIRNACCTQCFAYVH